MKIKARRLTWDEIREIAERFRQEYVDPPDLLPVPIEEIVELKLGIQSVPIPNLKKDVDIDGFLSRDFKQLFVDQETFCAERLEKRLRFTYAHEVGHIVLHKEEISKIIIETEEDWVKFRTDFPEEDLSWFELQAYEFAGRLLVPRLKLVEEMKMCRDKIDTLKENFKPINDHAMVEIVAMLICDKFNVSEAVIEKRIRTECVWKETGF